MTKAQIWGGPAKALVVVLIAGAASWIVSSMFGSAVGIIATLFIALAMFKTINKIMQPLMKVMKVATADMRTSIEDMTFANDMLFESLNAAVKEVGSCGRGHALDRRDAESDFFWKLFVLAKGYNERKIIPESTDAALCGVAIYRAATVEAIESLEKMIKEHRSIA